MRFLPISVNPEVGDRSEVGSSRKAQGGRWITLVHLAVTER